MKNKYVFFIKISLFLFLCSCKFDKKQNTDFQFVKKPLKYAKGFEIYKNKTQTKIVIKQAYQNDSKGLSYVINKVYKRIIPFSTTHIAMLELLNSQQNIVAFPNPKYISSVKTRKLIDANVIKDVGNPINLNTELILELKPDMIIGFGVNGGNKALDLLNKNGIPVIYNSDWLENTPLGRAEWIKFFGVLVGKERQADSIFNRIEIRYNRAKLIAQKAKNKPSILAGNNTNSGGWLLPAGESYIGQLFKDANTNYLWSNTKGNGSINTSFELVLDKAQNADFWITTSFYEFKNQLVNQNKLIDKFDFFKKNAIYLANKKGVTGGLLFYESAIVFPDLLLKDIIKITHPELLKNYNLNFFSKVKN